MTAIHCQRIEAALRKAMPGTGERYQKLARLHWQSAALAATLATWLWLTPSSKLSGQRCGPMKPVGLSAVGE
jgi:hypothetical protein